MNLTWTQQSILNCQLKSEVENYLIKSSQIHSWSFDGYQSNLLLGFKLIDQRDFEPILVKLPDLLAKNLAQLQAASEQTQSESEAEKICNKKDLVSSQDQVSSDSDLAHQNLSETYEKEQIKAQESPVVEILKHFKHIDDPRADANRQHKLSDIIAIAILAIICGADHWNQIEKFGKAKRKWLSTFLELPAGIPSHDTFNRVFARLDPDQFRSGFISWVNSIRKMIPGEIIAIDGKQNRRTHDKKLGKKAIHMVSAWASQNKLVFGQFKVDDKSNEITAIPELLKMLYIKGCIITIDAMGCQKAIASCIVEKEADYVLALKGNQKNLHKEVQAIFESIEAGSEIKFDYFNTVDKNHGRVEIRQCWTVNIEDISLKEGQKWTSLRTIALVIDERIIGEKKQKSKRFFISSLPSDAQKILDAVRSHWSVETSLHWVLDMAFREDECRLRSGHGAQNFAMLRHLALSLLKQENSSKDGIQSKRLQAGWDNEYLLEILKLAS